MGRVKVFVLCRLLYRKARKEILSRIFFSKRSAIYCRETSHREIRERKHAEELTGDAISQTPFHPFTTDWGLKKVLRTERMRFASRGAGVELAWKKGGF